MLEPDIMIISNNVTYNTKKKMKFTWPVGNLLRNSGVLLSIPIWNDGCSTLIPAYFAAIRPLKALGLSGYVYNF